MPQRDRSVSVQIKGLGQLNRSLGRIDKRLKKESVAHIRAVARKVRDTARDKYTPKQTGALAKSLRYSAGAKGAAVTSNLPQAPVHEYGGTIAPRGAPITIPRSRMIGNAVDDHAENIADEVGDLLDRIARTEGF
jgi:phage gpG-like protein